MEENMKKIVLTLALVAAMCVCSTASISAWEEDRSRFHFRTVSFSGDAFTQLLGINDSDTIAGYHGATVNKGFVFTFPNDFDSENFPNSTQTQVIGISNRGYTDGFYIDAAGIDHPYIFDSKGGVFSVITIPAAVGGAQATGISDKGAISGFYIDSAGKNHGFLISKGEFRTL